MSHADHCLQGQRSGELGWFHDPDEHPERRVRHIGLARLHAKERSRCPLQPDRRRRDQHGPGADRGRHVGNTFELLVNGTSIGTYTDANHRFDGAGYFGFVTCRTDAEYDDLVIQTEQSYTDNFNVAAQYGGYLGRWLTADPRTPGVFGLSTQGGGVWRSVDHGLTWQRITDTSGEGLVNYRPRYGNTRQSLRVPRERLFLGDR